MDIRTKTEALMNKCTPCPSRLWQIHRAREHDRTHSVACAHSGPFAMGEGIVQMTLGGMLPFPGT